MNSEICYIYPIYNRVSFHYIAKKHIEYLSNYVRVHEIDENVLDHLMWANRKNIIIHPALYPLVGSSIYSYQKKIHRLPKLLNVKKRLGGFEVADTNRVSEIAVKVLNEFDVIFVPSKFSKQVLEESGVTTEVEVIPHGLPNSFLKSDRNITDKTLLELKELKESRGYIYVLHFLLHSGFRKGSDLVAKVMGKIQSEFDNVILVVKRERLIDPFIHQLRKLKMIEIDAWFDEDGLRQLYDLSDIVLVPSRGGGFELNAIEAIARGIPTVVPNAGCFLDYIQYTIPVKVGRWVKVFSDNIVHVGEGHECDLLDLYEKLTEVIENLDKYKRKFSRYAKTIRKKYTWEKTGELLLKYLEEYGFLNGTGV